MIDSKKMTDADSFKLTGATEDELFAEIQFDLENEDPFAPRLSGKKAVNQTMPLIQSKPLMF